jgi:DNA-nicking Smr family endonuclease
MLLIDPDDMEPVEIPVEGTLDLHTFRSSDMKDLIPEYLRECAAKGILRARIIHGKGTGTLARTVRSILGKMPEVASFETAEPDEGSWGATIVRLRE